ncbi:hypothetical protein [Altererythrobacter sp. Root672]|uniref:hypothetical protein n=1 Tax=Altererythrobacter sp. Root672 TaxID=1736584 RepID=UPI0006FAC4E2|nr:hypothetical protein [Altererythrobacter sp. Root672]KRA84184.1 hypothetical protein ASD76_09385 [Altererythrobacter sp. Root672]
MIEVHLSFVPPGGGEVDYGLKMLMPALPREGDYISVMREGLDPTDEDRLGSENFIVRRVWWHCTYPDDGQISHTSGDEPMGACTVNAECEFAIGPYSSKAHRRAAESKARYQAKEFEATNY